MIYTSTMTKTGQVFFPKAVRLALGLEPGKRINFELKNNTVTIKKTQSLEEVLAKLDSARTPEQKTAIKKYRGLTVSEAKDKWAFSSEGKKALGDQYGPKL
ncbi:hypothetical protein IJ380_00415 [Candidatus Saccharibacteria bacterium]|nr:hypothetical protein [Candidatus Saccharibacteria bacterium]